MLSQRPVTWCAALPITLPLLKSQMPRDLLENLGTDFPVGIVIANPTDQFPIQVGDFPVTDNIFPVLFLWKLLT